MPPAHAPTTEKAPIPLISGARRWYPSRRQVLSVLASWSSRLNGFMLRGRRATGRMSTSRKAANRDRCTRVGSRTTTKNSSSATTGTTTVHTSSTDAATSAEITPAPSRAIGTPVTRCAVWSQTRVDQWALILSQGVVISMVVMRTTVGIEAARTQGRGIPEKGGVNPTSGAVPPVFVPSAVSLAGVSDGPPHPRIRPPRRCPPPTTSPGTARSPKITPMGVVVGYKWRRSEHGPSKGPNP